MDDDVNYFDNHPDEEYHYAPVPRYKDPDVPSSATPTNNTPSEPSPPVPPKSLHRSSGSGTRHHISSSSGTLQPKSSSSGTNHPRATTSASVSAANPPTKHKSKHYSTSKAAYANMPASALRQMVLNEEKETRDLRRLLNKALIQLNEATKARNTTAASFSVTGAGASEAQRIVENSRLQDSITDANLAATRAQHDADVNKALLENAQKQLDYMRERMKSAEEERDEAQVSASKSRAIARRLREEKDKLFAREEGRRQGFDEGLERAKALAALQGQRVITYIPRERTRYVEDGGGIAHIDEHTESPASSERTLTPPPPPPPKVHSDSDRSTKHRSRTTDSSSRSRHMSEPPPPPVQQPEPPPPRDRRRRRSSDSEQSMRHQQRMPEAPPPPPPPRPPSTMSSSSIESSVQELPPPPRPPSSSTTSRRASMPVPETIVPNASNRASYELEYLRMPSPPIARSVPSETPVTPAPIPVPPPPVTFRPASRTHRRHVSETSMNSPASVMTGISSTLDNELLSFGGDPPSRGAMRKPVWSGQLSAIPEAATPTPSRSGRIDEWRMSASMEATPTGPPDDFFRKPNPSPGKNLIERKEGSINVSIYAPSNQSRPSSMMSGNLTPAPNQMLSPNHVSRSIPVDDQPVVPSSSSSSSTSSSDASSPRIPRDRAQPAFAPPPFVPQARDPAEHDMFRRAPSRSSSTPQPPPHPSGPPIYSASSVRGDGTSTTPRNKAHELPSSRKGKNKKKRMSQPVASSSSSTTSSSSSSTSTEREDEGGRGGQASGMPMSPFAIYNGLPGGGPPVGATPQNIYAGLPGSVPSVPSVPSVAATPRNLHPGLPGAGVPGGATPQQIYSGLPSSAPPPVIPPVIPVIPNMNGRDKKKKKQSKKDKERERNAAPVVPMTPGGSHIYSGLPGASSHPQRPPSAAGIPRSPHAIYGGLPGGSGGQPGMPKSPNVIYNNLPGAPPQHGMMTPGGRNHIYNLPPSGGPPPPNRYPPPQGETPRIEIQEPDDMEPSSPFIPPMTTSEDYSRTEDDEYDDPADDVDEATKANTEANKYYPSSGVNPGRGPGSVPGPWAGRPSYDAASVMAGSNVYR